MGESLILLISKVMRMKKFLSFLLLVGLLAACSQYTCPTYAKKEVRTRPAEAKI
jgi:hypothetical protein